MAGKHVRTPEQVYERYLDLTRRALEKVKLAYSEDTEDSKEREQAADFLDMAQRYFSDAQHFKEKGMIAEALAAVSYAHAWLDAGARIGLFDVKGDSELFTVD